MSFEGISFAERVRRHRVWENTSPALRIAADEVVRASGEDVATQAAALCRALRLGEDDDLPGADEVAWLRAKLEAVTRIAKERGRTIIAYFFEPLWVIGVDAGLGLSSDDYILSERIGQKSQVIASSFCDVFQFSQARPV